MAVMPARLPWMAEVLETQEQFPVKAGDQLEPIPPNVGRL